jgi:hypothetical protein
VAGIGGLTIAEVEYNVFHDNSEAIGADSTTASYTIKYNHFLGEDAVKDYGASSTVDATNNWWGLDGVDYEGNVDATYMVKTDKTLDAGEFDTFGIINEFDVRLAPDQYTITVGVLPI